jgi:hypothetical protein
MNVCSADRDIPSLHYPALPCLQLYFISLAYTKPTLIYVAIHALASMPSAPRLSEADSKTSTEVPCSVICIANAPSGLSSAKT